MIFRDVLGGAARSTLTRISRARRPKSTWIDVGAHLGEETLADALKNPALTVYAFEPNLEVAARLIGRASNYFVIPMAVAESEGTAELHINVFQAASSLLGFNDQSLKSWIGGEGLKVQAKRVVATIRLDTFMNLMKIESVDFLKIDAQGMDLSVVKSAGDRLRDIARIKLEVDVTPVPLYQGASSKQEVLAYLKGAGFSLLEVEKQTHEQEENLTFIRSDQARGVNASRPATAAKERAE